MSNIDLWRCPDCGWVGYSEDGHCRQFDEHPDGPRIPLRPVEYVRAVRLQEATEALRKLAALCIADRDVMRRGNLCYASEFEDAIESRGNVAERLLAALGEEPSSPATAAGSEAASGPSLDGSRPLTVYIAGPMTGLADHNFPAFHAETARLRGLGYNVLSPAEKAGEQAAVDASMAGPRFRETQIYKDFLKTDLRMVLDADAVALLPGWENSRGAQLEVHVANAVGIDVWYPSNSGQRPSTEPLTEGPLNRGGER